MRGPQIPIVNCFKYIGYQTPEGYGRYTRKGYRTYAHRWAYCDFHGIHPRDIEEKVVMHICDNPSCVNPAHLQLGTTFDNVRDMDIKGRRVNKNLVGEEHGNSKYTADLILKIQSEYTGKRGEQKDLAEKYGVSRTHVNRIVNHSTWEHLDVN